MTAEATVTDVRISDDEIVRTVRRCQRELRDARHRCVRRLCELVLDREPTVKEVSLMVHRLRHLSKQGRLRCSWNKKDLIVAIKPPRQKRAAREGSRHQKKHPPKTRPHKVRPALATVGEVRSFSPDPPQPPRQRITGPRKKRVVHGEDLSYLMSSNRAAGF
ncbi:MAG TPA: hypothetical protein VNA68_03185 [Candidatus Dormibacteraeota bacterium]|nr:hypothetical protein [Candidatus Dormibacteraeota bacterium]